MVTVGSVSTRVVGLLVAVAVALTACGGDASDEPDGAASPTGQEDAASDPPDEGASEDASSDMDMDDEMEDDSSDMDMDDEMEDDSSDMDMDDDMDMDGTFGEPAAASEADRVVEVNVDNDLRFEPADFEVALGETVTFRVTNTGDVEHEFVLGDEAAQQAMADMMAGGEDDHAHSGEMSNAVTVHPGETGELTWTFTTAGTVLVGCHVPGHYAAGMRGAVTVAG